MHLDELINTMIRSYFIIATGITASVYLFCLLLNPEVRFSVSDIGRILLMAFVSDLPFLIFYSKNELSKKQMSVRMVIHALVLAGVLLFFAFRWDWVSPGSVGQIVVFLLLVAGVYFSVTKMIHSRNIKLSEQINRKLNERYRR